MPRCTDCVHSALDVIARGRRWRSRAPVPHKPIALERSSLALNMSMQSKRSGASQTVARNLCKSDCDCVCQQSSEHELCSLKRCWLVRHRYSRALSRPGHPAQSLKRDALERYEPSRKRSALLSTVNHPGTTTTAWTTPLGSQPRPRLTAQNACALVVPDASLYIYNTINTQLTHS